MGRELLNEDVIIFYLNKKDHYPISDLFMQNFRQNGGGYIKLHEILSKFDINDNYKELKKKRRLNENDGNLRICGELKNNYEELVKNHRLAWLQDLDKNFILERENYLKLEPNQKWHLLISWYAYKIIMDIYDLEIVNASRLKENKRVFNWCNVKCPECCLWMFEAAYDNETITLEHILMMYAEAVEMRQKKRTKFSDIYWEKVLLVISRDKNKSK